MKKKVKFGIQSKLLICILPLIILSFAALIFTAYETAKKSIEAKTILLLEAEGEVSANEIHDWASRNLATLDTAVKSIQDLALTDAQVLEYLGFYLDSYEDFPLGMYIATEYNELFDASGWQPEEDLRTTTWYKNGVSNPEFAFGEPYQDSYTKEFIVTASRRIEHLNGRSAVAAADVNLSILSEVVSGMEIVGDGDSFIMDASTGIILAHKNTELTGTSVSAQKDEFYKEIYNDIIAEEFVTGSYASAEGTYLASISPIRGTNWYIVTRGLEDNIYSDLYALAAILSGVGCAVILLIVFVLMLLIHRITKPIQKLTNTILAVSDGDFTVQVKETGSDEVAVMAHNMKEFLAVMRKTLGSIVHISEQVDVQAKDSRRISDELHASANGQSRAMQQMRDNLQELVKSIVVIADNATRLAVVVSDTNEAGVMQLKTSKIRCRRLPADEAAWIR